MGILNSAKFTGNKLTALAHVRKLKSIAKFAGEAILPQIIYRF